MVAIASVRETQPLVGSCGSPARAAVLQMHMGRAQYAHDVAYVSESWKIEQAAISKEEGEEGEEEEEERGCPLPSLPALPMKKKKTLLTFIKLK